MTKLFYCQKCDYVVENPTKDFLCPDCQSSVTEIIKRFCDYCNCDSCVLGSKHLHNAKTESGKYICNVCYQYEVCIDSKKKKGEKHPIECLNDCEHRPKIVGEWEPYKGKEFR